MTTTETPHPWDDDAMTRRLLHVVPRLERQRLDVADVGRVPGIYLTFFASPRIEPLLGRLVAHGIYPSYVGVAAASLRERIGRHRRHRRARDLHRGDAVRVHGIRPVGRGRAHRPIGSPAQRARLRRPSPRADAPTALFGLRRTSPWTPVGATSDLDRPGPRPASGGLAPRSSGPERAPLARPGHRRRRGPSGAQGPTSAPARPPRHRCCLPSNLTPKPAKAQPAAKADRCQPGVPRHPSEAVVTAGRDTGGGSSRRTDVWHVRGRTAPGDGGPP